MAQQPGPGFFPNSQAGNIASQGNAPWGPRGSRRTTPQSFGQWKRDDPTYGAQPQHDDQEQRIYMRRNGIGIPLQFWPDAAQRPNGSWLRLGAGLESTFQAPGNPLPHPITPNAQEYKTHYDGPHIPGRGAGRPEVQRAVQSYADGNSSIRYAGFGRNPFAWGSQTGSRFTDLPDDLQGLIQGQADRAARRDWANARRRPYVPMNVRRPWQRG